MLRLKRVELQGFKSFCDRSEMRFHGTGVAAIVGPNGCGKSNLSDAISWVLGEQSAKTLRGSRMEDVIFAGTRDRKPVGLASVTMTLIDPAVHTVTPHVHANGHANGLANGHVEHKPEEVTITRRLYRSGDSEYLINGKIARLRDIQDLFMGTGLGPESYAIIEQGRIGQILSTKPQDRRAVIEEAAGITRFKTRKRLAEARLESAKANLARVFDILEEVSRQANSLKRQAAKTKRYSELRSEMIAQLRIALTGRYRMLEREAAKTALDLNAATAELQTLNASIAERESEYAKLLEATYTVEARLTDARKDLAEKRVEAERVRGRLESQAREISSIDQRLTQGEAESQDLDTRFTQQQLELDTITERLVSLEQNIEEASRALAAKTEERDRVLNNLRERERSMETLRQQVLRLLGESSILKNELAQLDQYLLGLGRDTDRIEREEAAASLDIERLYRLKAEVAERQSAHQSELETTSCQRAVVEDELAARKTRAADARRQLEELRNVSSRMKARKESLEEILSHRAYTTESVKRLFTAVERGEARELKPAGVLADFVEVDPRYEKAAEEFLHDELEYVVVRDWEQAEHGIAFMRTEMDGRATFLVHPQPDENIAAPAVSQPDGIGAKLTDVLRLTNGLSGASVELIPRLARCFLLEDRNHAQRLALEYPDAYFLLPDGVCYHGHAVSGGRKTGSGPLALKRELREISGQWHVRQTELDETRALLESVEIEIAQLSEELERLRRLQQEQEKDAVTLDHEMRKVTEELSRAISRQSIARIELDRLQQEGAKARQRRASSEQLVAEKEKARVEHEHALAEARSAFDVLQHDAARIAEEHSALRVDMAGLEERRRSEMNARQRIDHQVRDIAHRRAQIAEDMSRLAIDRARLLSDNIELDRRAGALSSGIADAVAAVDALAAEESKGRADLASADERIKAIRNDAQTISEKRSQTELELVRKQAELKYLEETSRKELNEDIAVSAGDEPVLDESGLAEAEQRYQDLRARIDALGPVNPQALEEFEEAQQRYDFLNAQRQDLLDSIRDTEKAIHDIDVESRKRFTEAFDAINVNFRDMFKTLFAGGVGEMRLSDAENIGDSGIDIVASPPGKKLQSVLLLSGGERALTAMALLMAIFKYQPSPFCVLDEVDAPLDEANIERLTRLLKEMSHQTQFIVITHAKRTMEAAQALYGVTMQEPGVSKLVSVRFGPPPPPLQPQLFEPESEMALLR